jgi:4-amino-4-deoxy-L-arabinose transferase-like glycosyltransferase
LAALLLAVFPPHIHFSRLGLNNVADPLFGTLALAFLARGWKGGRRMDYALGGAALGLTQYFYEGGRLLYPALAAAWLVGLSLQRPRSAHPRQTERPVALPLSAGKNRGWAEWRGIAIALLAALVVAAPVYLALVGSPETVNPRMAQAGLGADYFRHLVSAGDGELWRAQAWHLAYPLLAAVYLPDTSWFYGDRRSLLLPSLVPALLIGAGVAIWRWREPGALLLLLWLGGTALGLSLLVESASAPRLVVLFPALALLAALGIRSVAGLVMLPRTRTPVVIGVGALVAALCAGQIRTYFGPYLENYNAQIRFERDGEDAVFRALNFPAGTQVHIVDRVLLWNFNVGTMLDFWDADLKVEVVYPDDLTDDVLDALPRDVDHAFFIDPDDHAVMARLQAHFALEPPQYSPFNVPQYRQFVLYYAPAAR